MLILLDFYSTIDILMEIIRDIYSVQLKDTVLTTGNFDGVHLGHQYLITQMVEAAHKVSKKSVVVMFDPHPREVVQGHILSYLSFPEYKYEQIARLGVDVLVIIAFDVALSKWGTEEFIKKILVDRLGMSTFMVGFNHSLGNPTKPANLQDMGTCYGFDVVRAEAFHYLERSVSSSIIRRSILDGQVSEANLLLGKPYVLPCRVITGMKVGRTIGFPTANLALRFPKMLIPKDGVYAAQLKVGTDIFDGMLQVGYRPTLDDERGLTIEIHLFDFSSDLYEQDVDLLFVQYVRDNIKFPSVDELKTQLVLDKTKIRLLFTDDI